MYRKATLAPHMDSAHTIRDAVARVAQLRQEAAASPALKKATVAVKSFQAQRFAGTYADLLDSDEFSGAARFFLVELYSDKDYSQRDAQFARIAGTIQTFFPQQVVGTAVAMAELHVLTEELDHQMALRWTESSRPPVERYIDIWRVLGHSADRYQQLSTVLEVGEELNRLTRTPGLRLMLRMMRGPAKAAGLGSLQGFLEAGFDTFAAMTGKGTRAKEFLRIIKDRESAWLQALFESDTTTCRQQLSACVAQA